MKRQLLIFFSIGFLISLLFQPVKNLRESFGNAESREPQDIQALV